MLTKNQIWKYFHDFAQSHLQIHDFGYGDLWEISQSQSGRYCLLWVVPIPSEVGQKQVGHRYTIVVADREFKDQDNRVEVESDTFQICIDILAALDKKQDYWELEHSATITPFKEKFKDEVNGHTFDVILRAPLRYDSCEIPVSGDTPVPQPTCDPALIKVNDAFFGYAQSSAELNVPVQYENGTEVGAIVSGIVKIPNPISCEPVEITVNGNSFAEAESGDTVDVPVKTTAGNATGSIIDDEVIVPDVAIQINGVEVDTEAPGSTANILLENSEGVPVGSVIAEGYVVVADAPLTINGDAFDDVPAETPYALIVEDTNGAQTGSKVGDKWVVPAAPSPSGILYQFHALGSERTSYASRDIGERIQSGYFNPVVPEYPTHYAELDYTLSNYHYRLVNNNIFGNKLRFTDLTGGQSLISSGGLFIDHLTGNLWGTADNGSNLTWANAIAYAQNLLLLGETGFYLPSLLEMEVLFGPHWLSNTNLVDGAVTIKLNAGRAFWAADTFISSTGNAYRSSGTSNPPLAAVGNKTTLGARANAVKKYLF